MYSVLPCVQIIVRESVSVQQITRPPFGNRVGVLCYAGTNPTFSATTPANRLAKRRNKRGGSLANSAPAKVRQVAIRAVPPARMLDVVGPAEVFADTNKLHGGEPIYEVEIIAASENRAVPSQIGVPTLAHGTKTLLLSNLLRAH